MPNRPFPARLVVAWTVTGNRAPFATLTSNGLTIDLANALSAQVTLVAALRYLHQEP